ncbi:uncharacterized protein [Antedon mediterranea]|uniref:uncharacterized protein n=1 Tax=Antedon mediterranea TaxID=105859 RepID=UPI003AF68702
MENDSCNVTLADDLSDKLVNTKHKTISVTLAVTSFLLNASMVLIIVTEKALRKRNIFQVSLALSDICFAVCVFLLSYIGKFESEVFCICITFAVISIQAIGAVAVERFVVLVVFKFKKRAVATKSQIATCICIWFISLGTTSIFFIAGHTDHLSFVLSILDLIILATVYISYIIIYLSIKKHIRKMSNCTSAAKKSKKLILTFSLIIVTCTICWFPLIVHTIVEHLGVNQCKRNVSIPGFFILALCYSIFNPIVYGLGINEIQIVIKERAMKLYNSILNKLTNKTPTVSGVYA